MAHLPTISEDRYLCHPPNYEAPKNVFGGAPALVKLIERDPFLKGRINLIDEVREKITCPCLSPNALRIGCRRDLSREGRVIGPPFDDMR